MGAGQAPSVTQGLRDLQGLRFTVVGAAGFVGTRVCAVSYTHLTLPTTPYV